MQYQGFSRIMCVQLITENNHGELDIIAAAAQVSGKLSARASPIDIIIMNPIGAKYYRFSAQYPDETLKMMKQWD